LGVVRHKKSREAKLGVNGKGIVRLFLRRRGEEKASEKFNKTEVRRKKGKKQYKGRERKDSLQDELSRGSGKNQPSSSSEENNGTGHVDIKNWVRQRDKLAAGSLANVSRHDSLAD